MPHFINESNKVLVTTNYKVMFTRLKRMDHLIRLELQQLLLYKLRHPFSEHLMIVRDPYDKLVSFYKDKFCQDPEERLSIAGKSPQYAQSVFFEHLNIDKTLSREMLRQSLLNVSFDTMIKILPKVFYRDKHLHPQHWVTQINFHGIRLPTSGLLRSKILKLKQPDDMR